jgi:glycerol-3-phosphate dehydrogenase (NAD(P)+)
MRYFNQYDNGGNGKMGVKVGVLGAGSWGTALAILLCENGHDVTLWSALKPEVEQIRNHRELPERLPGVKIPQEIVVTDSIEEVAKDKDLYVFAVASPYVRSTAKLAAPVLKRKTPIVNVAKGIEEASLDTLTTIIREELKNQNGDEGDVAVLSGPSHAEEVSIGIPTTVVVGAKTEKTADFIQNVFMCPRFRVYTSPDIIGIELGGSIKNVIALAAGILDGLGYGDNTKAALITRGISEITRLGVKLGGKPETFAGLSGIGDLIVTCTSAHSRNWNAGYLIGKGMSVKDAMDKVHQVVEGVYCAKAALKLARENDVDMPIVEEMNNVLFNGKDAKSAAIDLLTRDKRVENSHLKWNE